MRMKIAIVGAGGRSGSRIAAEALRRAHQVTAVGPRAEKLAAIGGAGVATGSVASPDLLAVVLAGHDVVVSAVRFVQYRPDDLIDAVAKSQVHRLVVVGGAGSLRVASGGLLAESPNFPEAAKPEATAGIAMLERLRRETAVNWLFVSPGALFPPGERTGFYRVGSDDLLLAPDGKSHISMENYAIGLLDEIEVPSHERKRITISD
jgi:putative NADH-flavin reductase